MSPDGELSLAEYRELLAGCPIPTPAQRVAFADYFSKSASWCHQLRYPPPGEPFQFYLDPDFGIAETLIPDGRTAAERPAEECGVARRSTDYRRLHCGILAFNRGPGTMLDMMSADGKTCLPMDLRPKVVAADRHRLATIPAELMADCTAPISAFVFPFSGLSPGAVLLNGLEGYSAECWPVESGGEEACRAMLARARWISEDPDRAEPLPEGDPRLSGRAFLRYADWPLYQFLEAERQRQLRGIVAAIDRVIERIYGPGAATAA